MGITLSLVIPTIGKPSLAQTLASCRIQKWLPGDHVMIVSDGAPSGELIELCAHYGYGFNLHQVRGPGKCWGHSVRNEVNERGWATGSHIMNLDDDDALAPNAISTIREEIGKNPTIPHLFQMDARAPSLNLGIVWKRPWGIEDQNVSSANIVTPNARSLLGHWAEDRYNGDMAFIEDTVRLHQGRVRWVPFISHICRPTPVYLEGFPSPPTSHLPGVSRCATSRPCSCS